MSWVILVVVLLFVLLYGVSIFNKLIRLKNMVAEAWSGMDVQLKKRYDLIPNIVAIVKAYAAHEKNVLESITQLRSQGLAAHSVKEQEAAEVGLSRALGNLFVVVERYPELKANQNFLELQRDLSKVENDLQKARRYYNGSVRNYNILIEQFPSNLIASVARHRQSEYFDIKNESERAVPEINL